MSEALIFVSSNPQYDDRLFIELQVQYMKIPSSNLGRTFCLQKLFLTFRTIFVNNMFCKRRASDKDLPVQSLATRNSNGLSFSFCMFLVFHFLDFFRGSLFIWILCMYHEIGMYSCTLKKCTFYDGADFKSWQRVNLFKFWS